MVTRGLEPKPYPAALIWRNTRADDRSRDRFRRWRPDGAEAERVAEERVEPLKERPGWNLEKWFYSSSNFSTAFPTASPRNPKANQRGRHSDRA